MGLTYGKTMEEALQDRHPPVIDRYHKSENNLCPRFMPEEFGLKSVLGLNEKNLRRRNRSCKMIRKGKEHGEHHNRNCRRIRLR